MSSHSPTWLKPVSPLDTLQYGKRRLLTVVAWGWGNQANQRKLHWPCGREKPEAFKLGQTCILEESGCFDKTVDCTSGMLVMTYPFSCPPAHAQLEIWFSIKPEHSNMASALQPVPLKSKHVAAIRILHPHH